MKTIIAIALLLAAAPGTTGSHSFVVDILDTKSFNDVNVIHSGLQRADGVTDLSIVRSNRNFVRLAGTMEGDVEHLISDINGLSQDRFSVDIQRSADGTLAVTLRRLGPPPAP